eukprot:CAMPEP_0173447466 /NCGR_PEP_ID=MMETSP1357-20121228/38732_1 /TAXON_ID=77926 /ORGANISM="Hemiselmis rufescens, Strain PCC563" /LENGTH=41 /DNA_ID= /DNA_START= /DNA_END= /DNA_ORIENTATION=
MSARYLGTSPILPRWGEPPPDLVRSCLEPARARKLSLPSQQ